MKKKKYFMIIGVLLLVIITIFLKCSEDEDQGMVRAPEGVESVILNIDLNKRIITEPASYGSLVLEWAGVVDNGEDDDSVWYGPAGNIRYYIVETSVTTVIGDDWHDDDFYDDHKEDILVKHGTAKAGETFYGPYEFCEGMIACGSGEYKHEWIDLQETDDFSFFNGTEKKANRLYFKWRNANDSVRIIFYESDEGDSNDDDPLMSIIVSRQDTLQSTYYYSTRYTASMDVIDQYYDKSASQRNKIDAWISEASGNRWTFVNPYVPKMFVRLKTYDYIGGENFYYTPCEMPVEYTGGVELECCEGYIIR